MRRVMLLDRLVELRYCLRYEGGPIFIWMEDALDTGIVLLFIITCPMEANGNFSVARHKLGIHLSKLSVMHFEILNSETRHSFSKL